MTKLYGYADRRAIRSRTLTRTDWRTLTHTLRKARRSAKHYARAVLCLSDLERDSGTDCEDILEIRKFALGAHDRDADASDCCGIGVLRAKLAVTWYPLRRRATQ